MSLKYTQFTTNSLLTKNRQKLPDNRKGFMLSKIFPPFEHALSHFEINNYGNFGFLIALLNLRVKLGDFWEREAR